MYIASVFENSQFSVSANINVAFRVGFIDNNTKTIITLYRNEKAHFRLFFYTRDLSSFL